MRKKKRHIRLRSIVKKILLAMGICAVLSIAGTIGAVEYDMPLLEGIKQLIIEGVILGIAYAGYYFLDY